MPRRSSIESCTVKLQTWKPFLQQQPNTNNNNKPKPIVESSTIFDPKPNPNSPSSFVNINIYNNNNNNNIYNNNSKRPCLSDRTTALDSHLSRLSLFDDSLSYWKRRRRCSRSVSGRSSDRCCSVGGGTCSDLPVATGGTDSSGELFLNGGDGNWGSDVSEASRGNGRREREERESLSLASGVLQIGSFENQGNESGYGSEPGYRGDAEIGYGDEVDTEEDEHRLLVWGDKFQGRDTKMEIAGENTLQKAHHRCRRKKHDVRMVDALG